MNIWIKLIIILLILNILVISSAFAIKYFDGEVHIKQWSQLFIDLLTLFTLIVTAVFVIKYWEKVLRVFHEQRYGTVFKSRMEV